MFNLNQAHSVLAPSLTERKSIPDFAHFCLEMSERAPPKNKKNILNLNNKILKSKRIKSIL